MSRGRQANHAYCITDYPRAADIRPGSRPAPELHRARRLDQEHAGLPAGTSREPTGKHPPGTRSPSWPDPGPRRQRAVGDRNPATRTVPRRQPRRPRPDLGRPNPPGPSRPVRAGPTRRPARRASPASPRRPGLHLAVAHPARSRSRRTRRQRDPATSHKSRSMNGARDVARVLDARIRRLLEGVQPQPPVSWARPGARHELPRSAPVHARTRDGHGRPDPQARRARRRNAAALGTPLPRPSPGRPGRPGRLGAASQPGRQLPGTVRLLAP